MSAKAGIESAGKCLPEAQQDLDVALPDKKSVSTLTFDKIALELPSHGTDIKLLAVRREHILDDPKMIDTTSGVRLWEGGVDLAQYLAKLSKVADEVEKPRLLELGAGHGIPAILAAKLHGFSVTFHDRSVKVLREVAAVNWVANEMPVQPVPDFLGGDWAQLLATLTGAGLKYDVVLAAEAIYKIDAYQDIISLLRSTMAPKGFALIAGKRFYFGCGGGTASFAAALKEEGFHVEVAKVIEDGKSNIREILCVKHMETTGSGLTSDTATKRRKVE